MWHSKKVHYELSFENQLRVPDPVQPNNAEGSSSLLSRVIMSSETPIANDTGLTPPLKVLTIPLMSSRDSLMSNKAEFLLLPQFCFINCFPAPYAAMPTLLYQQSILYSILQMNQL